MHHTSWQRKSDQPVAAIAKHARYTTSSPSSANVGVVEVALTLATSARMFESVEEEAGFSARMRGESPTHWCMRLTRLKLLYLLWVFS